jgi:hypothetical protein
MVTDTAEPPTDSDGLAAAGAVPNHFNPGVNGGSNVHLSFTDGQTGG